MKKVMYAFVLLLSLAGGLGFGILRQRQKAGSGDALVLTTPVETPSDEAAGSDPNAEASPSEEMASGEATPESTPEEGATETATEETATDSASTEMASAEPTPDEVLPQRSFASGELKDPVKPSRKSRTSSAASSTSSWSEPSTSGASSVPYNTEIETPAGTVIDETPVASSSSSRKSKAAPTPEPVVATSDETVPFESVDDLPTVDTGSTTTDEWDTGSSSTASAATAAPTPDPFASSAPTEVAMIPSGGSSELVFPSGSSGRASLKKVTQQKRGAESVVKIQINGTARYKVLQLKNPARVWVDFEDTEVPGGTASPISGSTQLIKEISATSKTSAGGPGIARVQIILNAPNDKPPTVTPKGTGEASGSIEVVIGGQDSF